MFIKHASSLSLTCPPYRIYRLGYGFVEFESREAAEESVAKYHEGFFMGNKIRVELSHGGGRTAKYSGEPGACFKCGQQGHWARFVCLITQDRSD